MGPYELLKVGERAMTLARVFNTREGFGIDDDRLAERSDGPTRGGAPAGKLQELDVAWAAEYLPK